MKILWLAPSDMTTEATMEGLASLHRHEIFTYSYDRNGIPVDHGMLRIAEQIRPNVLLYIGQNNDPFLASESTFLKLKAICPTVLLCFDASDKTWTPILESYRDHDVFSLIVSIDGNDSWPQREIDFTALTPVCEAFYI